MIAAAGSLIAHLGGRRGDRLSLCRDGETFLPVADLGWDAAGQFAPQRRLALTPDAVLVLEPVSGPLLLPPLRVRRFDLTGSEGAPAEGAGVDGIADLSFVATAGGAGGVRIVRCGIDPASGMPTVREEAMALGGPPLRWRHGGIPLEAGGAWWYALGHEGLLRVGAGGARRWRGKAAGVQVLHGRVVGLRLGWRWGLWVDGAFRRLRGSPPFSSGRVPYARLMAPWGSDGVVVLRRRGGRLPVRGGPSAHLPAGTYGGLVSLGGRLLGLAEGEPPRLVPVGF